MRKTMATRKRKKRGTSTWTKRRGIRQGRGQSGGGETPGGRSKRTMKLRGAESRPNGTEHLVAD